MLFTLVNVREKSVIINTLVNRNTNDVYKTLKTANF